MFLFFFFSFLSYLWARLEALLSQTEEYVCFFETGSARVEIRVAHFRLLSPSLRGVNEVVVEPQTSSDQYPLDHVDTGSKIRF